MSRELTWEAIAALDDATLNMAIEAVVFDRHWVQSGIGMALYGRRKTPTPQSPATRVSITHDMLPDYTASWDLTMALSRRYGVWSERHSLSREQRKFHEYAAYDAQWLVRIPGTNKEWPWKLLATTEHEERVARCRLALWRATNAEEG